ncbi:MAG TPA: type II secretion system F family protein [Streptosporangiaceae bacterium]|nr:type II secretion system F family protein [Streptosporangiaceae bacterium]
MSGSALLLVGAAAFCTGIFVLVLMLFSRPSTPRGVSGALSSIERHYGQEATASSRQDPDKSAVLPTWAKSLAIRLSPGGVASSLQRRLDLAGNPPAWTADRILAVKGIAIVIGAAFGVLFGVHKPTLAIVYAAILGAGGFFLPDVLLYNAGIKRQALIVSALPDALDMMTVCVEAGLGFDGALAQVARNTKSSLAEEFARTLQEMQIGLSRAQALRGMVARTTVPELRSFVGALVQASELGIPVARVLREQSSEMRIRRRQRAEERAQKVPVKIMFPLVTCLFPALLVVIIGPGVISIAHSLFA